jgi:hypothetical protein
MIIHLSSIGLITSIIMVIAIIGWMVLFYNLYKTFITLEDRLTRLENLIDLYTVDDLPPKKVANMYDYH